MLIRPIDYVVSCHGANYITMFYNSNRMHSSIGYKTPNQLKKSLGYILKMSLNCVRASGQDRLNHG